MVKDNEADRSDDTIETPYDESRPDECVKSGSVIGVVVRSTGFYSLILSSMKIGADQDNPDGLSCEESVNDIIHSRNQSAMSIKEELVCNPADRSQRNDDQGGKGGDGGDTTDKPYHVEVRIRPVDSQHR